MVRTPLLVITLSCFLGLGPGPASAEVAWVTLTTERGEQMRALLGRPDSVKGRAPAVIYNHGTEVRMNGYQDGEGNDVGGFVRALVAEGYVVLAPIRTFERTTAYMSKGRPAGSPEAWDAVIQGGLRTVAAARAYLAARSDVDPEKIALFGFSEGGNVSLWAAIQRPQWRAVVLLSPAAISPSPHFRLREAAAADKVARINAPVFLALARDDGPPILEVATEHLIPNLQKSNPAFVHRVGYPGQHNLFWTVSNVYWPDVTAFLRKHLR